MLARTGLSMGLALIAAAALAHQGVQNPAVKARMDLMVSVAAETKVLGQMVNGAQTFDPDRAAAARVALITHANRVEGAFLEPETDPMTEALPAIWTDAEGFSAAVVEFVLAAEGLDTASREALATSFRALGASCSGCHRDYRE